MTKPYKTHLLERLQTRERRAAPSPDQLAEQVARTVYELGVLQNSVVMRPSQFAGMLDYPEIVARMIEPMLVTALASGPVNNGAQRAADELALVLKWMRDNEPVTVTQIAEVLRNREGVNRIEATRNARSVSAVKIDAAEICAEMAREVATQAARNNSVAQDTGDEFALGAAAQQNAQADALREAERRIRATTPAPATTVDDVWEKAIGIALSVPVDDKETPGGMQTLIAMALQSAASTATNEEGK